MKALYMLRPSEKSYEHIAEALQASIDTILLPIWSVPPETHRKWQDDYHWNVEAIRRIAKLGPVYPVLVWQDQMLPNSHPLNEPQQRIKAALDLVRETKVGGVVWDFEDYRGRGTGEKQNPVPKRFADMCASAGLPVLGGMPDNRAGGIYFDEDTYWGESWWDLLKYKIRRFFGGQKKLPGIWVEKFDDPVSYIRKMNSTYGGYWVYSHVRFGQRLEGPNPDEYVNTDPLPISWWRTLP